MPKHRRVTRRFSRTTSHRQLMFRNLAVSVLKHEQIKTTVAKGKNIRGLVEKLITKAKVDTLANRRYVYDQIRDKEIVEKLFTNIAQRFMDRPGGYLRVLKCGFRAGDAAPMAIVELVDLAQKREAAAAA